MIKKRKININKKAKTDAEKYPRVICKWLDIQADSSWRTINDLKQDELPICTTTGHLLTQSKGVTRIFGDFQDDEENKIVEIGNTTIIPNSVIVSIKKI
jgi:hypothetical protein|tara:strand:+ start:962 stop:1258 length:297 start_codon:yes stop_codon:yes gene_type:complete